MDKRVCVCVDRFYTHNSIFWSFSCFSILCLLWCCRHCRLWKKWEAYLYGL